MPDFVLIDFENVQLNDLARFREAHVRVFLGPHQTKIPVALAASLQPLGPNVEYIPLDTAGKNALDFQIAYHLGYLSATNPTASFQIVSNDAGYDPLIKHLRTKGVQVCRTSTVVDHGAKYVGRAIDFLKRRKASMPRAQKTLLSTLRADFRDELTEGDLTALIASLRKRGIVRLEGDKVSYRLPSGPADA